MPTLEQLEQAFRQADADAEKGEPGAFADARRLRAAILEMQQQQPAEELTLENAPERAKTAVTNIFRGLMNPLEGETATRFGRGVFDMAVGIPQMLQAFPPAQAINKLAWEPLGEALDIPLGFNRFNKALAENESEYRKEHPTPEGKIDWPRLGGNVAGSLALGATAPMRAIATRGPAAAGFLANRVRDALAGGIYGSAMPVYDNSKDFAQEKLHQAGLGALGSTALGAAVAPVARTVGPMVSNQIQHLRDMGVVPTIGQRLGPGFSRLEQKLSSWPILGEAIRSGRNAAIEDFNVGLGRKILGGVDSQLAKSMPKDMKPGYELIDYVGSKLNDKYDDLLPKLVGDMDSTLQSELAGLKHMAQSMPPERGAQFLNILKHELEDRFTSHGRASGETLKTIESKLGNVARQYRRSPDPDQRQLGFGVQEAQEALRRMIERVNPAHREELKLINRGWANFLRMENAAAQSGTREGVFSPAQFRRSVRFFDPTRKKSQFGRGRALLQEDADAAVNVLGDTIPNSGTWDRAILGGAMLGAGYAAHPGVFAAELGATVPYLPGGRQLTDLLLSGGQNWRQPIAGGLRSLAPPVGVAAGVGGALPSFAGEQVPDESN